MAYPGSPASRAHPFGTAHPPGSFSSRSFSRFCRLPERSAAHRVRPARAESRPPGSAHGRGIPAAVAPQVQRAAPGGAPDLPERGAAPRPGLRRPRMEYPACAVRGASLLQPVWIRSKARGDATHTETGPGRLLHFTTNFQATSSFERAHAIVEAGGVVSIKAHIFKSGGGITMLDGLDAVYCGFLERLWTELERSYGDSLWWTTLGEMAARCRVTQS